MSAIHGMSPSGLHVPLTGDAGRASYRRAYPAWRPTLANGSGEFAIADLLWLAGAAGD
jgi:hypothetical protein